MAWGWYIAASAQPIAKFLIRTITMYKTDTASGQGDANRLPKAEEVTTLVCSGLIQAECELRGEACRASKGPGGGWHEHDG